MAEQKPIGTVYRCPVGPHEFTRPGHDPSNDARCETHWGYMGARVRFEYQKAPEIATKPEVVTVAQTSGITPPVEPEDVAVALALEPQVAGRFDALLTKADEEATPPPSPTESFDALLEKMSEVPQEPEPPPTPPPALPKKATPTPPPDEPPAPHTRRRRG